MNSKKHITKALNFNQGKTVLRPPSLSNCFPPQSQCAKPMGVWFGALCLWALTSLWVVAYAQNFPNHSLSLILPSAPGDPTDLLARVIQPKLSERLGQAVMVDNRPGGSGVIASQWVAKSAPDGHTLLLALSSHTINPIALKSLPYDTLKDFAPVSLLARFPLVLAAHPSVKGNTLKEMIQLNLTNPGALNFASPGVGTLSFLAAEEISRRSGLNAVHLSFKGGAPALQALMGNQAQFALLAQSLFRQQVSAGKLKYLAVTSLKRQADLPDVPTVSESGFPGFEAQNWFANAHLERLQTELAWVLKEPEIKNRLEQAGFEVVASDSKELDRFVKADLSRWQKFAKDYPLSFD
jgi:tripartite-type tricarboxylate transporter receptor subunit TctC